MYLQSKVKAGVLLYSLLMASIFMMIVQIYINQTKQFYAEHQAHIAVAKAYVMAEMVRLTKLEKKSGQLKFSTGRIRYVEEEGHIHMDVTVEGGYHYQFNFDTDESNITNANLKKVD
ncbi:competence type IV pilus minor pilin ComGG [Streptococcus hongkongensis]